MDHRRHRSSRVGPLAAILGVMLALGGLLVALPALAAPGDTLKITPSAIAAGVDGSTFVARVSSNTITAMGGIQASVTFDRTILEVTSISRVAGFWGSAQLPIDGSNVATSNANGKVAGWAAAYIITTGSPTGVDVPFLDITFTVKACPSGGVAGSLGLPTGAADGTMNDTLGNAVTLVTEGATVTCTPTAAPTATPTAAPTATPTAAPTATPTAAPTATPTAAPTATPTAAPTATPTAAPTATPTAAPTATPTAAPTATPTAAPTATPTAAPTATPTAAPTATPTAAPTATPTAAPTATPTAAPTATPTAAPTATPTAAPTATPTAAPTATPTAAPTATPTAAPTATPTATPGASADLPPGGSLDSGSDGPSASDPVVVTLTTPVGGLVEIRTTPSTNPPPAGYTLVGRAFTITAPPATAGDPLLLVFRLDASAVPVGETAATIAVFRNGTLVPECSGAQGTAAPDPCTSLRETLADGDIQLTILTSAASTWDVGVAAAAPTPTPTATPTGATEGESDSPDVTPPPTDALGQPDSSVGSGLPIAFAAMTLTMLALLALGRSRRASSR